MNKDDIISSHATKGLSIIVPVYNEAATVQITLQRLVSVARTLPIRYEILVIDDGSTDTSPVEIQQVQDQHLFCIPHATNQGYGAALMTGFRQARYELIAILDADGTYPPEALPELLTQIADAVMVIGVRTEQEARWSLVRAVVKRGLCYLAGRLISQHIPDLNSGFRVMQKEAITPLRAILPAGFSWTSTVTVALLGTNQTVRFVPIAYAQRQGTSKFHPLWDTLRTLRCIFRAARWSASNSLLMRQSQTDK